VALTKAAGTVAAVLTEVDDGFACTRTTYDYRDLALTVVEGLEGGSPCSGSGLRTLTNTYDGLGRLLESKVTAGEGLNDIPSQSSFDGAGNSLSSASVVGGLTTGVTCTLNGLDEVVREARSDGSASRDNYDPAGNLTDRCYWAGGSDETCQPVGSSFTNQPTRHTSSGYDARNQRIEFIDAATSETRAYDPAHNYQLKASYLPTGGNRERQSLYSYDERHRLVGITHQLCTVSTGRNCSATTALGSSLYEHDDNDNRTRVDEDNGATSADRFYCYDAQNRLVYRRTGAACSSSAKDEAYEYVAAGNRTKTVIGGSTTNFAYNASGQLCRVGGTSCSTPNVTYDDAGRTRNWNGWYFAYDAEGRLAKACKNSDCTSGADRVLFSYDGEGRRTQLKAITAANVETTVDFRYQGDGVVEEWTDDALTRSYLVDEAASIVKLIIPAGQPDPGTYLISWNGHGDALALHRQNTDGNGDFDGTLTLANSYTYSTWGAPTTATHNGISDLGLRFLYVGQYGVTWDNQFGLGLHYMQARHYAPALGRFLQPDPSRLEDNHYGYAFNSPISHIDPVGTVAIRHLDPGGSHLRGAGSCRYWSWSPYDYAHCRHLELLSTIYEKAGPLEIAWEVGTTFLFPGRALIARAVGRGAKFLAKAGKGGAANRGLRILGSVKNKPLQNVINQMYKANDKFKGGTAGAIRIERRTGRMVGGRWHTLAGQERVRRLDRILRTENLSPRERAVAQALRKDLIDALSGR
jgi:RHS repeat-associated protein